MKNIKTFITVVNSSCSVSEAAEKLFITQTAVTKRISNLEQQVKIKLFIRKNNRLFLSDAGKKFFDHAKTIASTWDNAINELSQYNTDTVGSVRLATSISVGLLLPPMIEEFKQNYPKTTVELSFPYDYQAEQALLQNKIDLAIMHSTQNNKVNQKNAILLASHEIIIAVPKNLNIDTESANTIVNSLSLIPCLRLPKGAALDDMTSEFLSGTDYSSSNKNQHVYCHRIGMVKVIVSMIERGLGWSIIPKASATDKVRSIAFPNGIKYEDTYLLHQEKSKLNKPSIKFIEMLISYINANREIIENIIT